MKRTFICLALTLVSLPALADEAWPAAFKSAVLADKSVPNPVVAYDRKLVTSDGELLYHVSFDGSAPAGEQLKIVELADKLADKSDELMSDLNKEPDDIWCDDVAETVKGKVAAAEDENGFSVFTYQPTDPDSDDTGRKVIEKTEAKIFIDKSTGKPTHVSYRLKKPFSPIPLVAKVNSAEVDAECKTTQIGRPYNASVEIKLDLVIMGKKQIDHTIQTIENLRFPGLGGE